MRTQLPNRRPNATLSVPFQGHSFFITMGFDEEGRIREVFGNASRLDSDMDFIMSDVCILISVALQHGIGLAELAKSLKMKPDSADGQTESPASLIGEVVWALEREQIEVWSAPNREKDVP